MPNFNKPIPFPQEEIIGGAIASNPLSQPKKKTYHIGQPVPHTNWIDHAGVSLTVAGLEAAVGGLQFNAGDEQAQPYLPTKTITKKSKEPPLELNVAAKDANPWVAVKDWKEFSHLREAGWALGIQDLKNPDTYYKINPSDLISENWYIQRTKIIFYNKKVKVKCIVIYQKNHPDHHYPIVEQISFNCLEQWAALKMEIGVEKTLSGPFTISFPENAKLYV